MPGLRHHDAQQRAALLSICSYNITLDLTGDGETFVSTTMIRFAAADCAAATSWR